MALSPPPPFPASPNLNSSTGTSSAATTALRSVVFSGSVPLAINLARDELPVNADLTVDTYYVSYVDHLEGSMWMVGVIGLPECSPGVVVWGLQVQAGRHSYLPILLTQIRKQFLSLVLDDSAYAGVNEIDCWFEAPDHTPLRWLVSNERPSSIWSQADHPHLCAQALADRPPIRLPHRSTFLLAWTELGRPGRGEQRYEGPVRSHAPPEGRSNRQTAHQPIPPGVQGDFHAYA